MFLEGEDDQLYARLFGQVKTAISPRDIIEEFWVRDVMDLQWEVIRFRRLKACLLNAHAAPQITDQSTDPALWEKTFPSHYELYLKTRDVLQKGTFTKEKVSEMVPRVLVEVLRSFPLEEDREKCREFFAMIFGDFGRFFESQGNFLRVAFGIFFPIGDATRGINANDSIRTYTQVAEFFRNAARLLDRVNEIGAFFLRSHG